MIVVVGSGPSAIAASHALVHQGLEVTILDIGRQLEQSTKEVVRRMSTLQPEAWRFEDLAHITGSGCKAVENLHIKRSYGSSFCFAGTESPTRVTWNGRVGFRHSDAEGGLSNVWGAALLPYRQEDISDWPISIAHLEPHYRAVMEFLPSTAIPDDIERILPSYTSKSVPLAPSRQGVELLSDLEAARKPLRAAGIHFGRSRLAIQSLGDNKKPPCTQCGLCLAGCPYSLIYQSTQTLHDLLRTGRLTYRRGHLVERLVEKNGHVVVIGRDLNSGYEFQVPAALVFLAAGTIPTAKIVLSSLVQYDRPVLLRDSQYFILPLLRFNRVVGVESERLHTSAQVFIEMDDPTVSQHLVHMQVYGYSSILDRELRRSYLRFPMKSNHLRRQLLERLMVIQGFLHSNDSGRIKLVLKRDHDGDQMMASTQPNMVARKSVRNAARILAMHAQHIRALPMIHAIRMPASGSGYHSGGSFPMSANPGELDTDPLGRLSALPHVHLIDASIFPSIPATSITLTVMANAHRIATQAIKAMQS